MNQTSPMVLELIDDGLVCLSKTLTNIPEDKPVTMAYTTDEQPLPEKNDQPHIHDLVMADIYARKAVGIKRYGTPLQPLNGRDALKDAYEEVLDLACYLRQLMEEREAGIPYD